MINRNNLGRKVKNEKEDNAMLRNTLITGMMILLVLGIMNSNSLAKEYPTKPIEILCPYTAGSTVDLMIRLVAETAKQYLGQPLVVINKTGAGGSLAASEVISSKPDGYKLVELTNLYFATTTKTQKIPFDPNDLEPLANFIEIDHFFTVKGDSQWKTLDDLLNFAKKNPGKLRWGHVGRGIVQHLFGVILFRKAGVETIDVPYKGTPEQISAILGGHIDASVTTYVTVKDLLKAERLKALFAISDRRYSYTPDIPSIAELGFPEVAQLRALMGLYIHKNTPDNIKQILKDAFKKVQDDKGLSDKFIQIGLTPSFLTPDQMRETIRNAERLGVPILKELGLYIE
jgi:tripartite-type tricarboxylate transporter receptor subunit TctC